MRKPLVSLIIVNRNGQRWLQELLKSIDNQSYKNLETIIVDNGSTDDSIKFIKSNYPYVKLLQQDNYGFGAAVNKGVSIASGEFVAFFNEDMKLEPDMIKLLVKSSYQNNYKNLGVIIATEANYDGTDVNRRGGMLSDLFLNTSPAIDDLSASYFYAPGAPCFMFKDRFLEIGGFDESLFLYYEDTDISWRLRLRGYNLVTCDEAIVYHAGGGTTSRQSYQTLYLKRRNQLAIMLKNYALKSLLLIFPSYLVHLFVLSWINLYRRNYKQILIEIPAILGVVPMLPVIIKHRSLVQETRVVSDIEIMKNTRITRPTKLFRDLLFGLEPRRIQI